MSATVIDTRITAALFREMKTATKGKGAMEEITWLLNKINTDKSANQKTLTTEEYQEVIKVYLHQRKSHYNVPLYPDQRKRIDLGRFLEQLLKEKPKCTN